MAFVLTVMSLRVSYNRRKDIDTKVKLERPSYPTNATKAKTEMEVNFHSILKLEIHM